MTGVNSTVEQKGLSNQLLNRLRAAVLGANDGIVSTSSVVMGVAGATSEYGVILTAGLAALVAGALSMAVGEYVSVSSQSDAEKTYIEAERKKLQANPGGELKDLAQAYEALGVSPETATKVAKELTEKDALKAHLRMHFNLDPDDVNSPIQAAIFSLVAFTAGGLIPFLAVVFAPESIRIPAIVIAVIFALIFTGYFSARAGDAAPGKAILRVVTGGLLAMIVTYYVGVLFGVTVG